MRSRLAAALVTALLTAGGLAWGTGTPAVAGSNTHVRLMPLGASITEGYRSSTGNGYRGPLFNRLASEGYTPDFVGNLRNGNMSDPDHEGHSGWRTDQIAGIADATLARWKPNVVTLQIGTNDLAQNYQVPTISNRLDALIDRILDDVPGVTVLVSPLLPSTDPTIQANRAEYDRRVPEIVRAKAAAGKHVGLADTSSVKVSDLADDRHPGDAGYQKVADAFNAALVAADNAGWIKPPAPNGGPVRAGVGGGGKCADVNGANSANGTAVQIWSCNAGDGQWWTLRSDGTLRALGKCLDVTGFGTADGTKVELWDCNGGANQQWQVYNGGYRNPLSGRCLDDPGFSTTDGTRLDLWTCDGGANQRWTTLPAVA
ncbi:ricin-type beta-trefoil lectin domain protein [Kitasatospora sp. NPDC057223]|uniref:ricin-type beta-trefoil lectin domain protein n=1 Tax=Kitasatospora sp. NPDC057223 TaxID=3346055 RepID=UPI0036275987